MYMNTTPSQLNDEQRAKISQFLREHPVGVLASVNPDGTPSASPIYFGTDDQLNLTFTTKRDTQKHQNLDQNNKVMLAAFDATTQAAVQAAGSAIEVTDQAAAEQIFHGTLRAADQTGPDNVPPISKIEAGPYVAYRIVVDDIHLSEYGWGDTFIRALHQTGEADHGDPS